MNKKQSLDVLEPTPEQVEAHFETVAQNAVREAQWAREAALEKALAHHKINGGMLHPEQLIDNARKFHAYITGENQ